MMMNMTANKAARPVPMSDGSDRQETETASEQATDGLEIALPENAATYELLMGEPQDANPRVATFQDAYDKSMSSMDSQGGDHEACMAAGRAALEQDQGGADQEEAMPPKKGMMGSNFLNT